MMDQTFTGTWINTCNLPAPCKTETLQARCDYTACETVQSIFIQSVSAVSERMS